MCGLALDHPSPHSAPHPVPLPQPGALGWAASCLPHGESGGGMQVGGPRAHIRLLSEPPLRVSFPPLLQVQWHLCPALTLALTTALPYPPVPKGSRNIQSRANRPTGPSGTSVLSRGYRPGLPWARPGGEGRLCEALRPLTM